MNLHANAVLTVRQRERLCDLVSAGVTITAAALVVGCSRQTASKWVGRRRRGESLRDRSSRPHSFSQAHACSGRTGDPARTCRAARGASRDRLGPRSRSLDRACRPSAAWTLASRRAGATRGDRPLRALPSRRACARRHQEAGTDPAPGSPRYRRSQKPDQAQGRLAVTVRGDRRSLPAWLRLSPSRRGRLRARPPSWTSSSASTSATAFASSGC